MGRPRKDAPLVASRKEQASEATYKASNQSHKFTPSEKMEIAKRIAWFWKNSDIMKYCREELKKSITPVGMSMMRKEAAWLPVIEQFREQYIKKCSEVPLFHKVRRLEELQEIYEQFKSKGDKKEMRATLRDIHDEAEGKRGDISFNFTNVTHNEFHQMTDEDLQNEKMKTIEQLEKVRRLKLLTGESHDLGRETIQEVEEIKETGEQETNHEQV